MSSVKEELEEAKREGMRYQTLMQERIEAQNILKTTIIGMKIAHTEELQRKEVEHNKEVEAFKEQLSRMKKKNMRNKKRKRDEESSSEEVEKPKIKVKLQPARRKSKAELSEISASGSIGIK